MSQEPEKNKDVLLPLSILIAGIIIAGAVIYTSNNQKPESAEMASDKIEKGESPSPTPIDISVEEAGWPTIGEANAPVTIVGYSDFACGFCKNFAENTLPLIKKNYIDPGIVRFIYKDFVVVGGDRAAEAAHCAAEQGMYWEYHDLIFTRSSIDRNVWSNSNTHADYAKSLGLDADALVDCFQSRRYKDKVSDSTSEAIKSGGRGTPFFIVNGIPVSGAQPYEAFQQIIKMAQEL